MNKNTIVWGFVSTLLALGLCAAPARADAPKQVCGFTLGDPIENYKDQLNMDTAIPIRYMESIREVEINPVRGIKTGLIGYGVCTGENPIVRIKMKYADSSRKFYEELLKRFKARFGEPSEWRGDPFHILIAWKWSFTDADNNQISLTLSHNTMDLEEKQGNAVKLTLWNLIEKERRCFQEKHPELRSPGETGGETGKGPRHRVDWDFLVPR